jgi:hypothetical protein
MRISWLATIVVLTAGPSALRAQLAGSVLYPMFSGGSPVTAPLNDAYGGQVVFAPSSPGIGDAVYWSSTGVGTDLNPFGSGSSGAFGTDGTHQVGYAIPFSSSTGQPDAWIWNGTANSGVNLNPNGYSGSEIMAIASGQEVGLGITSSTSANHAMLWTGSAGSAVDLNPSGFSSSEAFGTNGAQQVGNAGSGVTQAFLWNGNSTTAVNLTPSLFDGQTPGSATAWATNGVQQAGQIGSHAVIWSGTASSVVDINPTSLAGIANSIALAMNQTEEVGYGSNGPLVTLANDRALLWSGTAASAINLQTLLPATGSWSYSRAYSIDSSGNVYGTAYGTYNGSTTTFAVEWSPVPEPTSASLLGIGGVSLLLRRRRRPA